MANNDGYEGWDRVAAEMHKATAHLFTNTEKAERLGVSTGTLKKLLAGEPVVHPAAIRSITQALGWPPDGIDRVRAGGRQPQVGHAVARLETCCPHSGHLIRAIGPGR